MTRERLFLLDKLIFSEFLVLFLLPCSAAIAAPPKQLSYGDFLASVANNSETTLEQASLQTLEADVDKAGAFPDPFFQFGRERQEVPPEIVFVNPMTEDPKPAAPAWVVGVTQEFPWPGKRESKRQAVAAGVRRTKAQIELAQTQRKLSAAEYYVELVKSKQLITVKKESLRELEQVLIIQTTRRKQGLGSHTDLFGTQTEIELLRNEVSALENELLTRGSRAAVLAGIPLQTAVEFDEEFPKELLVEKKHTSAVAGADAPPDLLDNIAAAQLAKKLASLEAERKDSLPSLTGSLALMRDDSKMLMFNAMLGVRVPLFSGSVRRTLEEVGEQSQATTAKERAWNSQRKELAFFQWEHRVKQARANLKTLDERLVPLAADHTRLLLSDFAVGKSSFIELNQARRTFLKLRESRIEMLAALALEGITFEKITCGLGDETIDSPMPRISTTAMEGGSSMPAQNEMGKAGMKGPPRTQGSPNPSNQPNRPAILEEPEDESGQPSGGGMGM